MWFKNLRIFRLKDDWKCTASELESLLSEQTFQPAGQLTEVNSGWIPPKENGNLVHDVDGQYLLALRTEKKLLPATVVNQFAKTRAIEIEDQQGYKPGRKQMKDLKEQIRDELLPKAFSLYKDTNLWIDTRNKWVAIDSASSGPADEIIGLLTKVLQPFPLTPVFTETPPASAMTEWLLINEAPANFNIDEEVELKATDDSRATVKYVRHSVSPDLAKQHIESGKQCTRLALTWADRVSFVVNESLELKRVTPLEVISERKNSDDGLDEDLTLMAGELNQLLNDLVAAFGGEKEGEF